MSARSHLQDDSAPPLRGSFADLRNGVSRCVPETCCRLLHKFSSLSKNKQRLIIICMNTVLGSLCSRCFSDRHANGSIWRGRRAALSSRPPGSRLSYPKQSLALTGPPSYSKAPLSASARRTPSRTSRTQVTAVMPAKHIASERL